MRALVVGGAGFLGSTLVDRLLAEGHGVDVVDDLSTGSLANLAEARADRANDLTFHRLDVGEPGLVELVARRHPEVVLHLAPVASGDGRTFGFDVVRQAARSAGAAKVVVAVDARHRYGAGAGGGAAITEAVPGRDLGAPGRSVQRAITDLEADRADHGLEFTVLVLAAVYGPRQAPAAPVSRLARWVAAGEPPVPRDGPAGPGQQGPLDGVLGPGWTAERHDLLFVDDAVDAVVRAIGRGHGLVINVGTGRAVLGADVAHAAVDALRHALPLAGATGPPAPPTVDEPAPVVLDPARAGMQLGWSPWTDLADGLRVTAEWLGAPSGSA